MFALYTDDAFKLCMGHECCTPSCMLLLCRTCFPCLHTGSWLYSMTTLPDCH